MNSQQKSSFVYSPPRREDNPFDAKSLASDFDNLNIPYHAREDSEPFSYFPDPRSQQATMLRSGQSGLSSPSMVRKILKTTYTDSKFKPQQQQQPQPLQQQPRYNSYNNHHQTPAAPLTNAFDDILYDSDVEYITRSTSTHNSYREPLKRSNTMDGLSWLAKQQQKLRAKKENKYTIDSTDYFQRANYMRSNTVPEVVHRTETVYPPTNNETVRYHTITTTATTPTRREVKEEIVTYHSDPEHDVPAFTHSRPATPAFPTSSFSLNSTPALPPKSPQLHRLKPTTEVQEVVERTIFDVPVDYAKFVRDTSKFWYKPSISREEAIGLLRNAPPGTFLVRDSTTFANAFGLVLKVAFPPAGVQSKRSGSDELVRHFLIEPTLEGVRLKGCANEPVFSSLSDLVYQHSMTALALPCRLIIPDSDLFYSSSYLSPAQLQLMTQGAACNVLYLYSVDTESLTGPEAVRKAVHTLFAQRPLPKIGVQVVHFKASQQGITLTDNLRRTFFRKHYPARSVSYCGMDPDDHRWSMQMPSDEITSYRIFGFIAKQNFTNICHLFCELEPKSQPANAIVAFVCKMLSSGTTIIETNVL